MIRAKRNPKKKKWSWEDLSRALHSSTAQCVYIFLAGTAVLCLLLMLAVTPQRYNLKVGDIAPTTITASKDVVDEISTTRQQEAAAASVEPTYVYKEGISAEVMQDLQSVLTQATAVQKYGQRVLQTVAPDDQQKQKNYQFTEAEMKYARSLLTQLTLADYQLDTLLRATEEQMTEMCSNLTAAVENTMNTTVRETNVNESIQYLQQIIGLKTDISGLTPTILLFSACFVIVALLTKIIGCGLAAKLCRFSWGDSLKVGVGMMTRGEVALIVAQKGLGAGVVDPVYFTAVILLIVVSSIVTPLALKGLFAKA